MFKIEYLGRIEYDFQKSRVTGPWDHKVSVSAKKGKKNVHACLPLKNAETILVLFRDKLYRILNPPKAHTGSLKLRKSSSAASKHMNTAVKFPHCLDLGRYCP